MPTIDICELPGEAIEQAIWEANCDQDFLRQVCTAYIASLTAEEVQDYLHAEED
jgi:hypothetical protein